MKRRTTESFIEELKSIFGNKYDYSKVEFKTTKSPVTIICPTHGEFQARPENLVRGFGCAKCAADSQRMGRDEFIMKSKQIHGDKYDYSKVVYINSNEKVEIVCPEHGSFWVMPRNHLNGSGCPHCANNSRRVSIKQVGDFDNKSFFPEIRKEVADFFVNELNLFTVFKDASYHDNDSRIKIIFNNLKLSIIIKDLVPNEQNSVASEIDDLNDNGFRCVYIFGDEWYSRKEIVKEKIKHILGLHVKLKNIGARKCNISPISCDLAKIFLEKNHLQGYSLGSIYIGAFYNNELVSVMVFKEESDGLWNLVRFASDMKNVYPGLATKMLSFFIKKCYVKVNYIKTFLDRRWGIKDENVYTKMGFILSSTLQPDYRYIDGYNRSHKFGYRKQRLSSIYGFPMSMTEIEMTRALNLNRIWDAGLFKYVYDNTKK